MSEPQCHGTSLTSAHAPDTMKILTTGGKGDHASASRPNGTLDVARRPILDEEKFAAVKVVIEI